MSVERHNIRRGDAMTLCFRSSVMRLWDNPLRCSSVAGYVGLEVNWVAGVSERAGRVTNLTF